MNFFNQIILELIAQNAGLLLFAVVPAAVLFFRKNKEDKMKSKDNTESKPELDIATQSIIHELRTPLNGIIGMTELIRHTGLNPLQEKYLQNLENSSRNMLLLVNDLLELGKISNGKSPIVPVPVNLEEMSAELGDSLAISASQKGLEFVIRLDPEIGTVLIDQTRVRQILLNLLSNAIKFTSTGFVGLDISLINENDNTISVKFCVKDSGIGMSKKQIQSLFKPYSQGGVRITAKYGGTGLGLHISNELCKLMGTKISVSSAPNRGSSFCFELELEKAPGVSGNKLPSKLLYSNIMVCGSGAFNENIRYYLNKMVAGKVCEVAFSEIFHIKPSDSPEIIFLDSGELVNEGFERIPELMEICSANDIRLAIVCAPVHAVSISKFAGSEACFLCKPLRYSQLKLAMSGELGIMFTKEISKTKDKNPGLKKALVVDDDAINCQVLAGQLSNLGVYSDILEDGSRLIEKLKKDQYDIIFIDQQLNGVKGGDLAGLIRKLTGEINTPLLVGYSGDTQVFLEYENGDSVFDAFLPKPFKSEMLKVILSGLEHETSEENELSQIISPEIKNMLLESLEKGISELKRMIRVENYAAARQLSHKLKSHASYLMEDGLAVALGNLEETGNSRAEFAIGLAIVEEKTNLVFNRKVVGEIEWNSQ